MEDLVQAGVEIRACPDTQKKLEGHSQLEMENASEEDWKTEHLEMVLSVKTVAGLEEAIQHIWISCETSSRDSTRLKALTGISSKSSAV